MVIKHSFSYVFLGVILTTLLVSVGAYAGAHTVSDISLNMELRKILKEREKTRKELGKSVKQLEKLNASVGKNIMKTDGLLDVLEETINNQLGKSADLTAAKDNRFEAPYVSESLVRKGFTKKQEKASDMQEFLKDELMPAVKNKNGKSMTATEIAERAGLRLVARRDAAIDAYATGVAYLSESTKAQEEKIDVAKKAVESKKTLKDKQDGANEVALARLVELIEGNRLLALYLRLQAATCLHDLPESSGSGS